MRRRAKAAQNKVRNAVPTFSWRQGRPRHSSALKTSSGLHCMQFQTAERCITLGFRRMEFRLLPSLGVFSVILLRLDQRQQIIREDQMLLAFARLPCNQARLLTLMRGPRAADHLVNEWVPWDAVPCCTSQVLQAWIRKG